MRFLKQCFVIFSVGGQFFLDGCLFGWNAPAIPKLLDINQTTLGHVLSEGEVSLLTTISLITTLSLLSSGFLINKFGRKKIILTATAIHFVSWVVVANATNFTTLLVGKLISAQGFGLGYLSSIVYLSEITSTKIRGYALTSCSLGINVGLLTMYSVGPFVSLSELGTLPAVLALVIFVSQLFVPESPVYLLNQGNKSELVKTMQFLNRPMNELHSEERTVMVKINQPESKIANLKELLFVRSNLKSLIIVCGLNFGQQFGGSTPVLFHATSIFEKAGSSVMPHIATIIVGVIQLLSVFISSALVEVLGRRPLYLMSCVFTAITNFTLGLSFYLEDSPLKEHIPWLPLTSTVIFIIMYTIGFGALTTTLVGELLAPRVRPLGSSIAFLTENLCSILVIFTFPYLSSTLGHHNVFWMYSAVCAFMFFFTYLLVPETKGKTDDEIQKLMKRRLFGIRINSSS